MLKKNKNYKILIGLLVAFMLSATTVYAWYNDLAEDVSYDPSGNWLTSTTVQGALDELAKQKGCPMNHVCLTKKSTLALGDYVSYTPTKTSYTTDTSKTGYTSTQTINPSELNLWRVISLNNDGTADIISENVSSTSVYFSGQTGYQNFVGYLNVLASQYENSNQTVGSRHFGYNGQTEFITDTTYFANPSPWVCSTNGSSGDCSPDPDDYESSGGGDKLYTNDYNLVNTVLGTTVATSPSETVKSYWMASRYYEYRSSTICYWVGRYVLTSGQPSVIGGLYRYVPGDSSTLYNLYALRPIVTLKSTLSYSGVGSKEYPMEIQ